MLPVGTDRDAAHASQDGVGGIAEEILHQMEWQLGYRRCTRGPSPSGRRPAIAALRMHRSGAAKQNGRGANR